MCLKYGVRPLPTEIAQKRSDPIPYTLYPIPMSLERFIQAQEKDGSYERSLAERRPAGRSGIGTDGYSRN